MLTKKLLGRLDLVVPMHKVAYVLLAGVLLAGVAYSQTQPGRSDKAAGAVEKEKISAAIERASQDGEGSIYFVEQIGHVGAVEAIPMLEGKFGRTTDPLDKAKIAQVLVKLGDKDDTYWEYLVKTATPAVESDAPDFMYYDAQGKSTPGPSPGFIAWAQVHNVATNGSQAAEDAMYGFPRTILLLAASRDSRAVPLLRQALASPNHMIEVAAADGLAELQDKDSIPLIIEACKRAPAEAASAIAESLVYFDDSDAQRTVDAYIPKDRAKILREAKSQGKKTPLSY